MREKDIKNVKAQAPWHASDVEKWGVEHAIKRYGAPNERPLLATSEEAPQFSVDARVEPAYSNQPEGWVRGSAAGEPSMYNETGENYPDGNFDRTGRHPKGK
jgi:hypothetical protein